MEVTIHIHNNTYYCDRIRLRQHFEGLGIRWAFCKPSKKNPGHVNWAYSWNAELEKALQSYFDDRYGVGFVKLVIKYV